MVDFNGDFLRVFFLEDRHFWGLHAGLMQCFGLQTRAKRNFWGPEHTGFIFHFLRPEHQRC